LRHSGRDGLWIIFQSAVAGESAIITDTLTVYLQRDRKDLIFFSVDKPVYNNVGLLYSPTAEIKESQLNYLIIPHDQYRFSRKGEPVDFTYETSDIQLGSRWGRT
jgi:hypothetical protein